MSQPPINPKVARAAKQVISEAEQRVMDERENIVDSEDGVDHQALLEEIRAYEPGDTGGVEVLDGEDHVSLEQFACTDAASIVRLMNHIKDNKLQETRPWCAVWNLHRCLMLAIGK